MAAGAGVYGCLGGQLGAGEGAVAMKKLLREGNRVAVPGWRGDAGYGVPASPGVPREASSKVGAHTNSAWWAPLDTLHFC